MLCIYYFVFIGIFFHLPCSYCKEDSSENENQNRFFNQRDWMQDHPPGFPNYDKSNQFKRNQDKPNLKPYEPSNGFGNEGSFPRPPQFSSNGPEEANFGWSSSTEPSGVIFPESVSENSGSFSGPSVSDSSSCERKCAGTQEFNPVCGSDGSSYSNKGQLKCAQSCGKRVSMAYYGNCRTTPAARPTTSKTPSGMLISPGRTGVIDTSRSSNS